MKKLVIIIFVIVPLIAHNGSAQQVGESAPDFSISLLSGGNCEAAGPEIQEKLVAAFAGNSDYQSVGVDQWNYPTSSVQSFKTTSKLTMPLGLMGGAVSDLYDHIGYDKLLLIGKNGNVIFRQTIGHASEYVDEVQTLINQELEITSASDKLKEQIKLYPNPARERIYISGVSLTSETQIKIFDITGRSINPNQIWILPTNDDLVEINISKLPAGLYSLSIEKGGKVKGYKISVE